MIGLNRVRSHRSWLAVAVVVALALVLGVLDVVTMERAATRPPIPAAAESEPAESSTPPSTSYPTLESRPASPPTPTPGSEPERGTALWALAGLSVKGRAPKTGYDRDLFGSGWTDTDQNSCSTRDDVLRRDLRPLTVLADTEGCEVVRGTLADPYTGRTIRFTAGATTSDDVQVDHIVSLSDAWQKGAQQWTTSRRVIFANDLLELLATDGPTNAAKGDSDSASWLPPDKSSRCRYVARQVSIKAHFGLWVTPPEKAAMVRVLRTCPGEPVITSAAAAARRAATADVDRTRPAPSPRPEATPSDLPSADDSVLYRDCDAVRAAGADPIHVGDPGYSRRLDRDGDGVGCES